MWDLLGACALFLVGLRLSAFFSGNETGFYRASVLRLSIDAHSGDRRAQRLMWFVRNPSYFVATTLVGNNVANYTTTLAIGLGTAALLTASHDWVEVAGTLVMSPVIFIFGELLPKNLYYRAPLRLLRRDARWFMLFYRLFFVVSFPLIWLTKLLEWVSGSESQPLEMVLGRTRLAQMFVRGRQEGILTDVQNRLVHGLLYTASRPVRDSMTPANRVLGLPDSVLREDLLEYARRYGTSHVALHRDGQPEAWYAYVRVADVAVGTKPVRALLRTMPEVRETASRLEVLLALRNSGEHFAVVTARGGVLGIVSGRGLIEQLFRPAQALGASAPGPV